MVTAYSEKVDKKVVADRLAEWKKTNEQVKKTTASSQKNESTELSPSDSGSGQTITEMKKIKPQSLRMSHQKDNIKPMDNEKQKL